MTTLILNRADVELLVARIGPEACHDRAPLWLLVFRGKLEGARIWFERNPTEVVARLDANRAEEVYCRDFKISAVAEEVYSRDFNISVVAVPV